MQTTASWITAKSCETGFLEMKTKAALPAGP